MKLEEAMQKYGIPIPEDIFNYDETKYKEFHQIYLKSFYSTFSIDGIADRRIKSEPHIAVVLGGQIGAGKSSLIAQTKREFRESGRGNIILIDGDQYKQFYPNREEILQQCPEHYTKITATATSQITPIILKFATDNRYDFIFEGTMRNNRIVDTMATWTGYQIQVKVMAASRLRSMLWMAIRNAEFRLHNDEKFATTERHDVTYFGLPKTLEYLESTGLAHEIKIYTRGNDPLFPIEQFSSLKEKGISSRERLEELRKQDEIQFLRDVPELIEHLKSLLVNLSEDERCEVYKIIGMIEGVMLKEGYNSGGR